MRATRMYSEEQKAANAARAKRWSESNSERRKEIKRAYYQRHRERILSEAKAKNAEKPKKDRPPAKGTDPVKAKIRRQRWEEKNRSRKNEAARKRRAEKREQILAAEAEYRNANRERLSAIQRKWRAAHPKQKNSFTRRRRALKYRADGSHSADDIMRIRGVQRDRCACCRIKLGGGGHVDHIIALSKGGSNWPKNIQLLCEKCNCSKHNRDPIEFMRSRGRLL